MSTIYTENGLNDITKMISGLAIKWNEVNQSLKDNALQLEHDNQVLTERNQELIREILDTQKSYATVVNKSETRSGRSEKNIYRFELALFRQSLYSYYLKYGYKSENKENLQNLRNVPAKDFVAPTPSSNQKALLESFGDIATDTLTLSENFFKVPEEALCTIFQEFLEKANIKLTKFFLDVGLRLDVVPDKHQDPIIHLLVSEKPEKYVNEVLKALPNDCLLGAIDSTNSVGDTILHTACKRRLYDLAALIVELGADLSKINDKGNLPLDYALGTPLESYLTGHENMIYNLHMRGSLLYSRGNFYNAFETYKQGLSLALDRHQIALENESILLFNTAKAAVKIRLFHTAIQYITKVVDIRLRIEIPVENAIILRAQCYEVLMQFDRALQDWKYINRVEELIRVEALKKQTANLYCVLGVPFGVNTKDLKKKYKKLCREYHPDKSRLRLGNGVTITAELRQQLMKERTQINESKFKMVTEAYEILQSDERYLYDAAQGHMNCKTENGKNSQNLFETISQIEESLVSHEKSRQYQFEPQKRPRSEKGTPLKTYRTKKVSRDYYKPTSPTSQNNNNNSIIGDQHIDNLSDSLSLSGYDSDASFTQNFYGYQ